MSPSVNCENFVEPECFVSSQMDFPKYIVCEKIKNWYIETGPSRKCLEKLTGVDLPPVSFSKHFRASLSCSANG